MIKNTFTSFPLDQLTLNNFISYLRSTGWRRVKYQDEKLIVFAKDEEGEEQPDLMVLPAKETFRDYAVRITEAVKRLADIEQTTPDAIIQKIQSVGQDVIYLRLALPHTAELPSLEATSTFLQAWRNLVTYGACMERDQRRYFFGKPFEVGRQQAEHFQFAHTFQGSFGFTIESKIAETQQHSLWHGQPPRLPIQRKVLERITRGLLFAKQAEQSGKAEVISQNYTAGFNGNMCRAAVDMLQDMQNVQITYAVRWSTHLQASPDVAQLPPLLFGRELSSYLQEAGDYLEQTANADLEEERTVEGPITNLSSEDQATRVVTISAEGFGKVSFSLDAKDYAAACDAHRDGHPVSVSGRLMRRGRRGPLTLQGPHDFHVNQ
jgi:hypothetical protein